MIPLPTFEPEKPFTASAFDPATLAPIPRIAFEPDVFLAVGAMDIARQRLDLFTADALTSGDCLSVQPEIPNLFERRSLG